MLNTEVCAITVSILFLPLISLFGPPGSILEFLQARFASIYCWLALNLLILDRNTLLSCGRKLLLALGAQLRRCDQSIFQDTLATITVNLDILFCLGNLVTIFLPRSHCIG